MITVLKLKSDNFDCLVTKEAYAEIRLQMSTGDFHTHKTNTVKVKSLKNVYTLDEMREQEVLMETYCHACGNVK